MELLLPSSSLSFVTIFLAMVAVAMVTMSKLKKKTQLPPGPWKLPVVGSIHHLLGKIPHRALSALALKHGPLIHLRLGQVDYVVASSTEAAEEIMKTQDVNFAYRPELAVAKILFYGCSDIAFSPFGNYWRQLRRICIQELLGVKRVKFFSSIRDKEAAKLIEQISAQPKSVPINLSQKLKLVTNAVVATAAFGDKTPHQVRFVSAVKAMMEMSSGFSAADLFPSGPLGFIDVLSGFRQRLERIHVLLDGILVQIIEEHLAKKKTSGEKDQGDEDIVDVLLRLKQDGELEIPMSLDSIKAVILDMFSAGTDSSASTVVWAMAELMRNPEVMKKAQSEVRTTLQGKREVDESNISELVYVKIIIKETLRLHPTGPLMVPRECKHTCRVLGHEIPAGTRILVNAWSLGRDPRYWEDAEMFKPERFLESPLGFKGADFKYIPFGSGRRICPGIDFGIAITELLLARLLFHFDWELPPGLKPKDVDMNEKFGVNGAKKTELCLIATNHFQAPLV